jgi:hypothetical protein
MLYSAKDFFTEVLKNSRNTAFFCCGGGGESDITGGRKGFKDVTKL